jgi:eukaryotic-like serine/threonine-protein kinase
MGLVYRAWDPALACVVALKLVNEDTFPDESARRQLYTEAQIASSLNHANICRIKDVIEESGQAGIVMEFVEGQVLTNAIPASIGLPSDHVIEYGIEIAEAICHAHERDVIHRDLKSGNVMVNRDGRIKLLDFGLSKVQRRTEVPSALQTLDSRDSSNGIAGTPPYWAPEVLKNYPSDTRSDIWSFGVLLYEMASGQMPFKGATIIELGSAILHDSPAALPQHVPQPLAKIIYHCLRKEIGQRYQQIGEVRAALEAIGQEGGSRSRQPLAELNSQLSVIRSVAVLPLQNLSGAPDREYFADGLTESLITALARIGGLRVISRTSIMQYKHAPKTLPQIARELSVDAVVEGSVRRDGDRVRITAELIDARSDQHLWTETYDRDMRDILSLQSQVAAAIAEEIRAKLNPATESLNLGETEPPNSYEASSEVEHSPNHTVNSSSEVNPRAYDLYLRGRYFWNNQATGQDFRKAIEYYRQAIEIDPQSALTYAGLAHCLFLMGAGEYGFRAPLEVMPKAKEAALKSLSIDDSIAEAHLSLAMVNFRFEWDWEGAEKHLKRAIELNHGYYVAHYLYTIYLLVLGRFDEAFTEATIARQLSPLSPDVRFSVGLLLYASGQNEEAIEHLRGTVVMDALFPLPHLVLGLTLGRKGRFDAAIAEFEQALKIAGPRPLWSGYLGQVFAMAGKTENAVEILHELLTASKSDYVPPVAFAFVYAGLGKNDDAFHWLEKAVEERDGLLIYLKIGSAFDSLRSDERFAGILNRVGLEGDPGLKVLHPEADTIRSRSTRKLRNLVPPRHSLRKLLLGGMVAAVGSVILYVTIPYIKKSIRPAREVLAIQPFKTLGGDPDAHRLAEIVREEIFTRMSELHPQRLGVVELTTADSELSFEQACSSRKPTLILAGAVHRDGNQMAITDQLVSCRDQTGMVGDRHSINPDGAGMGPVVDDIVRRVLVALPKDIQPNHQVNPKAYEAYLQGRFEWNLRSTQSLMRAISYFQQAIEFDGSYAPSYAGLADCYSLLGSAPYTAIPPSEAFPKAKTNAVRALELDYDLAEAHVSLGYSALVYERNYPEAEREFLKAIELRPDYATAHQYYAYYLTAMGNVGEAINERKRALAIEPKSSLLNTALGEAYYQARQFSDSIGPNQQALAIDPRYADAIINIGRAYEQMKMYPQAQQAYQSILAFAPHEPALLALLGHLYAVTGRYDQAREIITQLREISGSRYVPSLYVALIYIGLEDNDQSFIWLDKAYEERCEYLVYLPTDPMADPIRNDPRFPALLERLGLKK